MNVLRGIRNERSKRAPAPADKRPNREVGLAATRLDRSSARALAWQIYDLVRDDILCGRLRPGERLASTRNLAADLGVSRNTVVSGFELLAAEGYLEAHVGVGTAVSTDLPVELPRPRRAPGGEAAAPRPTDRATARRSASPDGYRYAPRPFQLGLPALEHFPWAPWNRAVALALQALRDQPLEYGDPRGNVGLRRQISRYLLSLRGIECRPEQVFVVGGSQQGLDLAARVLVAPGDRVWLEDPGYRGARAALYRASARICPVPVDECGMKVEEGLALAPRARFAYVTPSHQYPLGASLALPRRLELLEWARSNEAFILEDDYDSEFRLSGPPLSPLAALDRHGRVVYVGTFSKALHPGLRLGYLVVPETLVDDFARARYASGVQNPTLEQLALAEFLANGEFARHLRRTRVLYRDRLRYLRTSARRYLAGRADLAAESSGLHAVLKLRPGVDDRRVADLARDRGVEVSPMSRYRLAPGDPAVVLGYAAYDAGQTDRALHRLAEVLEIAAAAPSMSAARD